MVLAAVCCCCQLPLLADGQSQPTRIRLSFLRDELDVCDIRRSNGRRVIEFTMNTVSRRKKGHRRVFAGHLDQVLGLKKTCERGLFSHSAKPATAGGIVAVDPRFRLHSVMKNRTTLRQA